MSKTVRLVVFTEGRDAAATLPYIDCRESGFQDAVDSVVAVAADRVVFGHCAGPEDLQRCDMALSVAEARAGRHIGEVKIIASAADSAQSLLRLPLLGGMSARLVGITWNREAFCSDIACDTDSDIAAHARMQVVIVARASGLPAYDSSYAVRATDFFVSQAAGTGFSGHVELVG